MKTFNKNVSITRKSNRLIFNQNISILSTNLNQTAPILSTCNNILQLTNKRFFAEGEEIRYPKVYKNIFNKRVSRDGKRVFYTVFPYDYNEPWPFPPVYDRETGEDLNKDDVWGDGGQAPPSSITGKPKRALGHYPWLGRPIVPLDEQWRWVMDDQIGPYPFFAVGRYESNRTFYWQWIAYYTIFLGLWYLIDMVLRGDGKYGNLARKRDDLFYKEHMAPVLVTWGPIGGYPYANPTAPIFRAITNDGKFCLGNEFLSYRFDHVFIPAAKEDMYDDEDPNYFKLPGYNC